MAKDPPAVVSHWLKTLVRSVVGSICIIVERQKPFMRRPKRSSTGTDGKGLQEPVVPRTLIKEWMINTSR